MSYFKIGEHDYSNCVCELKVKSAVNYNAQANAAGDTVVDKINSKREIEVGIIPSEEVEYYTIQSGNTSFKEFNLNFQEL